MSIAHPYEVAKGNEVRPEFIGQTVVFQRATTVDEALQLGHYENVEALVSAAEQQWLIGARQAARTELGRKEKEGESAPTLDSAAASGNKVKLGAPREAKEQKPKTPKAVAAKAAKDTGNAIFEKCLADPTKLARLVKMDMIDEAEFNAWAAARTAPAAAAPTA